MTFMGQHTVNETLDLIRAKDIGITDLTNARNELLNPPDDTWDAQFQDFTTRYNNAKLAFKIERTAVSSATPLVGDDVRTTETSYNAILKTLSKTPGFIQSGDFQDLWNRVQHVRGSAIPENIDSIQPGQNTEDFDLNLFKAADNTLKSTKKAAFQLAPWMITGLVIAGILVIAPPLISAFAIPLLVARRN